VSLDALRGAMALAVAIYHFAAWTHVFKAGTRANTCVAVLGLYSVQSFFIISGFCFFHLYRSSRFDVTRARAFYIRRFFRIAPLYYAVLALNLALGQAIDPGRSARRLFENVTLTFGLFHPNHSMLLGGWSIGIECVFYLAFPLLIWLTRARGALYVLALLSCVVAWRVTLQVSALPELQKFNAYASLPNHACLFLLGGVLSDLRRHTSVRLGTGSSGLGLGALFAGLLCLQPVVYDHFDLVVGGARPVGILACMITVLLCALRRDGEEEPRGFAIWSELGNLSYAVYLLHPLAWLITTRLLPVAELPRSAFALGLMLTLALASVAHHALERPFLNLGRRLSERDRSDAREAAAAAPS
jgi:peptidoglycan/LPS O-acetylase OafA/YrhL